MPDIATIVSPITDNLYGEEFKAQADDGRRYLVLHTAVGSHPEGSVLSARHLGEGAQIPRLINLAAIRLVEPAETALLRKYSPIVED